MKMAKGGSRAKTARGTLFFRSGDALESITWGFPGLSSSIGFIAPQPRQKRGRGIIPDPLFLPGVTGYSP